MADRWYPALAQVLGGATPTPTSSPTPSSSPSTGGGGCTATFRVMSQWGGSFQGEVAVKNTSAGASSAWTATFAFANGQQVTQWWSTTLAQTGTAVTAHNVGYNGTLAPGASTSFGFLATWNNTTNAVPVVSCTLA
jgi:cellulase/cellobiase CelA1